MDVLFFLNKRTAFIRQMYHVTSTPYIERIDKIENEEEPFISRHSNGKWDEESPFCMQYKEAIQSLDTLRLVYLSMLMSSFHSYFKTWTKKSGIKLDIKVKNVDPQKKGWFWKYRNHFRHHFNIDFTNSPVDLNIIEELLLVRNNIEHQSSIASSPAYTHADFHKLKDLSYTDELSMLFLKEVGLSNFTTPRVIVTDKKLLSAISSIEEFAEWFNNEIESEIYQKQKTIT